MRYRALDPAGDYSFGRSQANFLANSSACVAQAVQTRLRLLEGEWFLDVTEGLPFSTEIAGKGTASTYDDAIRERILGTPNVTAISAYSSALSGRALAVSAAIDTAFGPATVEVVL